VSAGTVLAVSTGFIVVSVEVLSEVPDTFLVELHAEVAIISEPAKARLKINFFIGLFLCMYWTINKVST